jgi:hypothetical protein
VPSPRDGRGAAISSSMSGWHCPRRSMSGRRSC